MEDYRKILQLVKPYWHRVALAALVSLLVSGLNGSLAWLVKPALDDILISRNEGLLFLLPLGVFLIFIARGLLSFAHEYLMKSAGQKLVMDLRNTIYAHILEMPMGLLGKNSSGELISKAINDTAVLNNIVSLTVKDLLTETFTVIALIAVAFWRRWDLTLISLVILPSAFYVVGRLGKKVRLISKRTQERISLITEFMTESFAGIKIIKAFCRQQDESARFRKINKDYYRDNMRATRVSEFAALLMETVAGLGIAFVIWYGGRLVTTGAITAGDFLSFLAAIFLVYTPAKRLAKVNVAIQQAGAPFDRISQLLSNQKETEGDVELGAIGKCIEFKEVSFSYPAAGRSALADIDLVVRKGEIVALVGKSGGGKTTLANLLLRYYDPSQGKIYMDGTDISSATFRSLRGQFGIVSQEVILFNTTVKENIAYGKPDATPDEIVAAAKAAHAHDFIMDMPQGYDTIIGERGLRLSGGQRQRLSIARAILRNPPILILDEATSSLDTDSEMMVQKALENLMGNRTTLVIAHRLSTIKRAGRIIVLEKGRIAESGTHDELYNLDGAYRKLYDLQFRDSEELKTA